MLKSESPDDSEAETIFRNFLPENDLGDSLGSHHADTTVRSAHKERSPNGVRIFMKLKMPGKNRAQIYLLSVGVFHETARNRTDTIKNRLNSELRLSLPAVPPAIAHPLSPSINGVG